MAVTKEQLEQYTAMKIEISKMREDIRAVEDSIAKLIEEGTVKDKVYGGDGGIQGFVIEGFPYGIYERRRKLLQRKRERLLNRENDLIELVEQIEKSIDSIPDSRDRMVFRKYFIKNETQMQIAREMYMDQSSVSKIISRYIKLS